MESVKVLVEGSSVFNQRSGVGQYTKHLLEAMADGSPSDRFVVFTFWSWFRRGPGDIFGSRSNIKTRLIGYLPGRVYSKLFKTRLALPVDFLAGERADVVWFPNFVRWPIVLSAKSLVTIYDLSYISHPQFTSPANLRYMERFVPKSLAKASHVITISENSKKEIMEYYKIPPEKISIVCPGVDLKFFKPRSSKEIKRVRQTHKLPNRYVLYVGTLEPRKNIEGLLDAYVNLPLSLKRKYHLVLAGGKGWLDSEIENKLEAYQATSESIHKLGYVADEDLPALYSGASLFVYPSFYEGFGMPPLEAMACGVPVITAGNSSLPEVVGKAAILINANDPKELTESICHVLQNDKLAVKMSKAGLVQARQFTWQASAQKMHAILKEEVN